MHFWIDKHSQTCGFSRRHRVPSCLSSTGGGGRRWRAAKPMVTPVHRFQPIECVTGQYSSHNHNIRRNNSHLHGSNNERESVSVGRSHAVQLDSSVFLDLPLDSHSEAVGGGGHPPPLEPPQGPPPPSSKHNNCGMKLSFAVVTAVIGGVRLFFQNQGMEMVYSLAFIMLITLCAVTMYRSMTRHNAMLSAGTPAVPGRLPVAAPTPSLVAQVRVEVQDLPPPPAAPHPLMEPPPPPYDIAVLLPQQIRQEDIPPPSYEKAITVS